MATGKTYLDIKGVEVYLQMGTSRVFQGKKAMDYKQLAVKEVYFENDCSKQWLTGFVDTDKQLIRCWQRPVMMINKYTRKFKAQVKT